MSKDYLDSLLFAAAKNAGQKEIDEYNGSITTEYTPNNVPWLSEIAKKEPAVNGTRKISFKNKLLIAAAAALLVCATAVGTIASLGRDTAPIVVSSDAGYYVLSYDLVGIKSGDKATDDVPQILEAQYKKGVRVQLPDGVSTVYSKDGCDISYTVRALDSDYSLTIGHIGTAYVELLVAAKYHGCMSTFEKDGERISLVAWNDGKYAYELSGNTDCDTLIEIAQSLY